MAIADMTHHHAPAGLALPFLALVAGSVGMGFSPIFVRLADVGPMSSAFWRVALALPALYVWSRLERGPATGGLSWRTPTLLAGLAFAFDLIFWHLSILNTTVANATLLATMAPVWVFCLGFLLFGQRLRRPEIIGLVICVAGGALLVRESFSLDRTRFLGDAQAIAVSLFFGLTILALNEARKRQGPALIMFQSTAVTAACLLLAAWLSGERMLPLDGRGWAVLIGLALISQVGGQGLLAFALGRLPVAFSSLIVFLEAVAAAGLGWVLLGEALGPWQWAGGFLVLGGIWIARPRATGDAGGARSRVT
jgi:drug/metabolite transporter (DMT)-like permease